ncbi:DUF4917 family protein [Spirulina sp. 06S082]|uniref:DUF4917 family protein n=1 Tax=Spirulina sp. 06S082 TaxID=3110248 RepID=UPI002B1F74A0|nr:DUF4917 family protein [Spirulina sp. 06S082]MEA5470847.1 DUF4917 family protein [Spirulina sp. 06S082]
MNTSYQIKQWEDIKSEFQDSILLGNGSSIAIHQDFKYESLFGNAELNSELKEIFEYFKTKDFEFILRMLWHSYNINQSLKIQESKTESTYQKLRENLIESVRKVHIKYTQQLEPTLKNTASFLKNFKNVFSLNYDLLIYWSIIYGNKKLLPEEVHFKDCFLNRQHKCDWDFMRKNKNSNNGNSDATLVFYLHGNLVLATDLYGQEVKLDTKDPADDANVLIDLVVEKWESGNYLPLFVSEGTSEQKIKSINRSPYLKNVYEKALKDLGKTLVIYGWSMGEQDEHILKEICSNRKLKKIAISVRKTDNETENNEKMEKFKTIIEYQCKKINQNLASNKKPQVPVPELKFFDSASPKCWIY